MGATSVGEIGLDLVVNNNNFNEQLNSIQKTAKRKMSGIQGTMEKQMGGIQNLATKVGRKLAAAFAVKKLVDFGKQCIDLGSDLSEVQNVVDVTFPAMSKQVDSFAQNAAKAFGLSETMAKKYVGTFGAMAKAFGFSEQQAYDMSTTLTGLAGDVASFYNLSQDEAYTKLKSVFTGETESLKDLGVVMTQTALDAYAMANGYGKTTAAMSEAEKVALRYSFVQSKLATASGDFMRTSDGWANQVRVLKLQTESFMAAIGQGLINVLTPAIKVINTLMGKLVQLANAFKNFTDRITGKKTETVSAGLQDAAEAAAGIDENINAAGKSAKKLSGVLSSDELNILSSGSSSDGSAAATGTGADTAGLLGATKAAEDSADKIAEKFSADALGIDSFVERFNSGLKKIDFASLKNNFSRVTAQLPVLAEAAGKNVKTVMEPLGGLIGTILGNSIAGSVKTAEIGLDGLAIYLEDNVHRISKWSEKVSQSFADGFNGLSSLCDTVTEASLNALEKSRPALTAGINDFLTGCTDLTMSLGTVLGDGFAIASQRTAEWAAENEELIESSFTNLLTFAGEITSLVGDIIGDIGKGISDWWEERGATTFGNIIDTWNSMKTTLMEWWQEVIMPCLDCIRREVDNLWTESLRPLWTNLLNLFSSIGDFVAMIWDKALKPCLAQITEVFAPTIKSIFAGLVNIIKSVFGIIADVCSGIIRAVGGILDFLTGVFTGNWKKAWNGIKDTVKGICEALVGIIKGVANIIIDCINAIVAAVYCAIRAVVNGVGNIFEKIGDFIGEDWGFSVPDDPPKIPRLASGGFVKANTPQLAMIGDNRHQGEVVSPEGKLQEMADNAVRSALAASGNLSGEQLTKIISLLNTIIDLLMQGHTIEMSGTKLGEAMRRINSEYFEATGKYLLEV